MQMRYDITAEEVHQGDFLADLDNGYVPERPEPAADHLTYRNNVALDEDMVLITFHDADGNENYLILQPDHPITVKR